MGVGEMSVEAFTSFLQQTLGHAAALARNGAIAFVCMDWRHMGELLKAGKPSFPSSRTFASGTQGKLTKEEAQDLLDFTTALLERLFTEPKKIALAEERRQQRCAPACKQ